MEPCPEKIVQVLAVGEDLRLAAGNSGTIRSPRYYFNGVLNTAMRSHSDRYVCIGAFWVNMGKNPPTSSEPSCGSCA